MNTYGIKCELDDRQCVEHVYFVGPSAAATRVSSCVTLEKLPVGKRHALHGYQKREECCQHNLQRKKLKIISSSL